MCVRCGDKSAEGLSERTVSTNYRSSSSASWRRCPDCGSSVKRILRTANDKRRWDAESWRRFRCRQCEWQGLLPTSEHIAQSARSGRQGGRGLVLLGSAGRVMVLLLLAGALVWGAMLALQLMTGGG